MVKEEQFLHQQQHGTQGGEGRAENEVSEVKQEGLWPGDRPKEH